MHPGTEPDLDGGGARPWRPRSPCRGTAHEMGIRQCRRKTTTAQWLRHARGQVGCKDPAAQFCDGECLRRIRSRQWDREIQVERRKLTAMEVREFCVRTLTAQSRPLHRHLNTHPVSPSPSFSVSLICCRGISQASARPRTCKGTVKNFSIMCVKDPALPWVLPAPLRVVGLVETTTSCQEGIQGGVQTRQVTRGKGMAASGDGEQTSYMTLRADVSAPGKAEP
jgi:hypothetical protein